MQRIQKVLNYWLPPILWALIIFIFSSFPTVQTTEFFLGDFLIKKSAHLFEYGVLATLLYRALINSKIENYMSIINIILIYVCRSIYVSGYIPPHTPLK